MTALPICKSGSLTPTEGVAARPTLMGADASGIAGMQTLFRCGSDQSGALEGALRLLWL